METLQHLELALGLATLAGINLYLTVFAAGLSIHYGLIVLSPQFHDLQVLGHPAVLTVAGIFYAIEFFADKIPWVDSAWDLAHTIIRPLGGAFLALRALGQPDPAFDVVVALLGGAVTLTTHGAKASTRLLVNGSPEPFSNVALSLTEDAFVCGGLGLMGYSFSRYPLVPVIFFVALLGSLLFATPRVLRFVRVQIWLFWKKLTSPAADAVRSGLTKELPAETAIRFHRLSAADATVSWAVACLSGAAKGIPTFTRGWLVASPEEPRRLYFIGRRGWRKVSRTLELDGFKVNREPQYLSENLVIYHVEQRKKLEFIFDRSQAHLVRNLVDSLRERLGGGGAAEAVSPGSARPALAAGSAYPSAGQRKVVATEG